jgi:hypothetical protein
LHEVPAGKTISRDGNFFHHWKWQKLSEGDFALLMTSESVGNAWNEAERIQLSGNLAVLPFAQTVPQV